MTTPNLVVLPLLTVAMGAVASGAVLPTETPSMAVRVQPGGYNVRCEVEFVKAEAILPIDAPEVIAVRDEEITITDEKPEWYVKGAVLKKTVGPIDSTRLPNAISPDSVRLHSEPGGGVVYVEGKDYFLDRMWGGVSRLETGSIPKDAKLYADYDVFLQRIDVVQVSDDGVASIKKGVSGQINVEPPATDKGCHALANIFVPYRTSAIAESNIYRLPAKRADWRDYIKVSGRERLSNTIAKLEAGQRVSVVCWGDSVTEGGSPTSHDKCYVELFRESLKRAYPKADIALVNAGIGGSTTGARRDGFDREVLAHAPDLITVEFVNDCGYSPSEIKANWAEFVARARAANPKVEFIFITPHLVRPDWMTNHMQAVDVMRQAAEDNGAALADASNIWENLRSIGVPYETLLANEINHPNNLGHEFFVASLMTLLR